MHIKRKITHYKKCQLHLHQKSFSPHQKASEFSWEHTSHCTIHPQELNTDEAFAAQPGPGESGITSRTKIYISLPCFGHRSGCKQFGNTYSTNRKNWRFSRRNSPSDKTTLQFVGPPSPACNVRRQLSCRELPVVVVLLVLLLEPLVIVGRIWALEAPAKERSGSGVSQEFSILLLQRYWTLEELWKLPKTMVSPPQKGRCPRW